MIYCSNHGHRQADFHCGQCEAGFCKDCIGIKVFDRGKVEVCNTCKNLITSLEACKPVEPFWTRTKEIFLYPLQEDGYMMMIGWAIAALFIKGLATTAMAIPFPFAWIGGAMFLAVYYSLLISYFYRIVARAEEGKFDIPDWTEFQGIGTALVWPVIQFNLAMLASFWPAVALTLILIYLSFKGILALLIIPGVVVVGLLLMVGFFLLPMCLLLMGVFQSLKILLNPLGLLIEVRKILKEYLILIAFIVGLLVAYNIVSFIFYLISYTFGPVFKYILSFPIDGVLQLYLFMVLGHLLGYTAYQTRFKLRWWPETMEEPVFMVRGKPQSMNYDPAALSLPAGGAMPTAPIAAGTIATGAIAAGVIAAGAVAAGAIAAKTGPASSAAPNPAGPQVAPPPPGKPAQPAPPPAQPAPVPAQPAPPAQPGSTDVEIAQKISQATSMLDQGRYEDATVLFEEILSEQPDNLGALRGMVMTSINQKDTVTLQKYADMQVETLIGKKAFDHLWEMYGLIKKNFPDFSFNPENQMMLARWLSHKGMDVETAKVLRELAVKHPEDPAAPKALFQCAEILWKKCGKPEASVSMFEYLLKRYPDGAFIDRANQALLDIKSGG